MEGLNQHLQDQAQMAGGQMGGGGGSGQDSRNIPVSGDIVGFNGIKLDEG